MSLREQFFAFDDRLAAKGVPPLTSWWRDGIGQWLDALDDGRRVELFACAGRGSAKSTVVYRLALFFTLFGDFQIPIGERHYAIVISRLKEEAAKGIVIISRWLDLLDVRHNVSGDEIEIATMPRGIRVVAPSVAGTSGWRAYFIGKDERSKWRMSMLEEQDAEEVDTSAAAMTATHDGAISVSFGSAWVTFGGFYHAITNGSDDTRIVLGPAPTWVAAPHITRASCERKERDPKKFAREYECVFQNGVTSALDPEHCRAALRRIRPGVILSPLVMAYDSSAGRGDAWAWLLAQWIRPFVEEEDLYEHDVIDVGVIEYKRDAHGNRIRKAGSTTPKPELRIWNIRSVDGRFADDEITAEGVVAMMTSDANRHGAEMAFADTYQQFFLSSALARRGIQLVAMPWTAESKQDALARLRELLRAGAITIEPNAEGRRLVDELISLEEIVRPSGAISLGARRGRHDDRAACLLSLLMADAEGALVGGLHRRRGEFVVAPHSRDFADLEVA